MRAGSVDVVDVPADVTPKTRLAGGDIPSELWLIHILHPGQWMLTRELRSLALEYVQLCPESKFATCYVRGKVNHIIVHGDVRAYLRFAHSHGECMRHLISIDGIDYEERVALVGRGFSFDRMHIGSWSEEEDRRSVLAMLACCTPAPVADGSSILDKKRRIRKLDVSIMVTDGTTLVGLVELLLPYTDSVTFRMYVPIHLLMSRFFPLDECVNEYHLNEFNRTFANSLRPCSHFDLTLIAYGGFQMHTWTRQARVVEWVEQKSHLARIRTEHTR